MTWNPAQYLKFGGERLRPAVDLLARIPLATARSVVDLGCGPGNVTPLLRARWPQAHVTGVDNSGAMLERARAAAPDIEWQQADVETWAPPAPVDVLYSNAALQWLGDHEHLLPRLAGRLAPHGVLAVQMPAQHVAPSHRLGYELARSPRWNAQLGALVRDQAVAEPARYYDMLRPHVASVDIWTSEYLQVLTGDNPVAEFSKGSFVGSWLSALAPDDAPAFEAAYRAAVLEAYPPRADGVTLFPFRRLFIVAQR